jgi:hypothetical protein
MQCSLLLTEQIRLKFTDFSRTGDRPALCNMSIARTLIVRDSIFRVDACKSDRS